MPGFASCLNRSASALARHGHIRLGDCDRLCCSAGYAALRVSDGDAGATCFQTAAWLDRYACCNQRGAVGIRRLDNHASRRELLTSLVGGLRRRRCDLDGRELDAATASADQSEIPCSLCDLRSENVYRDCAVGVSVQVNGIFPFSVMSPTFTPASPHAVRLSAVGRHDIGILGVEEARIFQRLCKVRPSCDRKCERERDALAGFFLQTGQRGPAQRCCAR